MQACFPSRNVVSINFSRLLRDQPDLHNSDDRFTLSANFRHTSLARAGIGLLLDMLAETQLWLDVLPSLRELDA